jgi:hypothetical protein
MFKPSVTIHKSEDGKLEVLECSEDAEVCLKAYKECKKAGQLVYVRKGDLEKRKKVVGAELSAKPKKSK